jgi:hypothetical protein
MGSAALILCVRSVYSSRPCSFYRVGVFDVRTFNGALQLPINRMMSLVPTDEAFELSHLDDEAFSPIVQRPPRPKFSRYGINQMGQLYEYGETHAKPKHVLADDELLAFAGIHSLALTERAGDRRKVYLDLTVGTPHPYHLSVISLPCFNSSPDHASWPVRSLLSSLTEADKALDLRAMAGKIGARRGTKANPSGFLANFIDLFVGDDAWPLLAPAIEPDRHTLETTVDRLRRSLELSPQFQ